MPAEGAKLVLAGNCFLCKKMKKQEQKFNFDLKRMKERVEGEFAKVPDYALKDTATFKKWLDSLT